MGKFKDFFTRDLPLYFHIADTYKDSNDEGLLIRYLRIFEDEMSEEVYMALEGVIEELDLITADKKYLPYLADLLGNPPDIFLDEDLYRLLLRNITQIYKIKGTLESYELFFGIFGFNVTIDNLTEPEAFRYDADNSIYDGTLVLYDNGCATCSSYNITFTNIENPLIEIPQSTIDALVRAIKFVEPINAKLNQLIRGIQVSDDVVFCIEQLVRFSTVTLVSYDVDNINYDVIGINYDLSEPNVLLTLPFDCQGSLPQEGISIWAIEDDFIVSPE